MLSWQNGKSKGKVAVVQSREMNKKTLWVAGVVIVALLISFFAITQKESEKFISNVALVEKPPGIRSSRIVSNGEVSFVKIQGKGYQSFRDEIISKNRMHGFSGGNSMQLIKASFLRGCDEVDVRGAIFVYGSNESAIFAICKYDGYFYLIRLNI